MRRLAMLVLGALAVLMVWAALRQPTVLTVASTAAVDASVAPHAATEAPASDTFFVALYIFVLAGFVGFEVIGRVSPTLHTPLMSATNAISGISLVGSIVAAGAQYSFTSTILGFIAVAAATTNVVGGFMITDRMLKMFKRKDRTRP